MEPTRNTELFDKIAAAIEAEPDTYNQKHWACNVETGDRPTSSCRTAFCVAGHAAHLSGCEPLRHTFANGIVRLAWEYIKVPADSVDVILSDSQGYWGSVAVVARNLLGLSEHEACMLFDSRWRPPRHETVSEALRRIGRGGAIASGLVPRPVIEPTQVPAAPACNHTPDPMVAATQRVYDNLNLNDPMQGGS